MNRKRLTIIFLTAAMLVAPASMHAQGTRQKLKKENQELRNEVDSLKKAMEKLRKEKLVKDSLAKEMIGIYEENEDKSAAGLNPEDYNAETTDSLLNIWYMHRQVSGNREGEGYDMDSVRFSSNVSDAVMKERLENMNSFITLPYNEKVRNFMILYSEKMPTKMGHILGLCQYYMPIFEETFNKYKLPDELKYVAIIESALNPTAVSRAGAKGMWQFMMQTAKSYGLEINSYVDERLDPFKSSDAAARYLQDSYRLFGDWNLAISSYNCGPGNVNKAIRRSGSRDFWAVYDYLPRETRGYVPAFVGAMYAIKYSKEYGLQASGVQMPAQVDTFEIHRNLHLQQVADMVGIPMSELKNLNPQYIKDIIPGNNKTYILRLPFNYSSAFIENEDSIYTYKAAELLNPQTLVKAENSDGGSSVSKPVRSSAGGNSGGTRISYKVRSGDSLGKIASRHGVTVAQLKSWNHLRSNTIKAGQRLYIYKKGSSGYSSTSSKSSSGSSSNYVTYTVRSGDTLSKIASRYGTTVSKIQKANGIGSKIRAGQKLRIPR
jgi:membrane-bound lytic murein transglycosylase D